MIKIDCNADDDGVVADERDNASEKVEHGDTAAEAEDDEKHRYGEILDVPHSFSFLRMID